MSQQFLPKNIILYIFNFIQKGENKIYKWKKYFKNCKTEKYRRKQYLLNYLCISKKYLPDLINLLNQRVLNGNLRYPHYTIANSNKEIYNKFDFKGYRTYKFSIQDRKLDICSMALFLYYNYYESIIKKLEEDNDIGVEKFLFISIKYRQIEIVKWIVLNKKISYTAKSAGKINKFICKYKLANVPFAVDQNHNFKMFEMNMKIFNFIVENQKMSITAILLNSLSGKINYLIIDYILDNLMHKIELFNYQYRIVYFSLKDQNGRYDRFLPLFLPKIRIFGKSEFLDKLKFMKN